MPPISSNFQKMAHFLIGNEILPLMKPWLGSERFGIDKFRGRMMNPSQINRDRKHYMTSDTRKSLSPLNRTGNFLTLLALVTPFILPLIVCSGVAASEEVENSSTFVFYFENDLFGNTDKYYTSAFKLSWISKGFADSGTRGGPLEWLRWFTAKMPTADRKDLFHTIALSLGQSIYTPKNIETAQLLENDRPYAGWSYLAAALQTKNFDFLNTLELNVGIVGPSSLAEQFQKISHKWLGDTEPQGWDNQINDELGLMIAWQRFWRVVSRSVGRGLGYDVIPHAGITVGNVLTYANAGGKIRFGYNLPADFGSSLIGPGGGTVAPVSAQDPRLGAASHFGVTIFAGVDGRAVARNIFLDGNTFRDSASVDKNYLVADISAGVSVIFKRFKITYTQVYRTEEFRGQEGGQLFGSFNLAYTF